MRAEGMAAWLIALLVAVAAFAPLVSNLKVNLAATGSAFGSYVTTRVTFP